MSKVFLRTAASLEHLAAYRNAGVNIALGTDTFPNNILEGMRLAAHLARIQSQQVYGIAASDVFYAATVGGARALLRANLGRAATGWYVTVGLRRSTIHSA